MIISLIVAMDENQGIGIDNRLPWRLSSDLQRFKRLTMGHCLIMGRKTHQSIGKPLPGRLNIVVSRNPNYRSEGCVVVNSLDQALQLARERGETEVFVIGGGEIFRQALPLADRIYLTQVHSRLRATAFFPKIDLTEWEEIESVDQGPGPDDQYPTTYRVLHRKIALDNSS